jgi:hypothetical protein
VSLCGGIFVGDQGFGGLHVSRETFLTGGAGAGAAIQSIINSAIWVIFFTLTKAK